MKDVIKASLHSYRSLATKKQLQITVEVAAEFSDAALKMLGVVDPSGTQWFALTRLVDAPLGAEGNGPDTALPVGVTHEAAVEGQDRPQRTSTRSQKAAFRLTKKDFCAWLVDTYWTGKEEVGDYDGLLKRVLGIGSKTELDTNPEKAKAWEQLMTDFYMRNYTR